MKHLYTPNSNKPLLSRTTNKLQDYFAEDVTLANYYMEANISDIEFEPNDSIINFLLNYSKSLEVFSLNTAPKICMLTKN